MADLTDLEQGVLQMLIANGATVETPVNLLVICPPLVDAGYTQDQIVNVLFSLEGKKMVELLEGNRARLR
jgi:hypothetical protein